MSVNKSAKMMNFVNYRMKVVITDNRALVGTFMAFDKHMNIVLGDCEEIRKTKPKKGKAEKTERRALGLVLLRGESVVQMNIEGPPVKYDSRAKAALAAAAAAAAATPGLGMGRAAGRGLPVNPITHAPAGLSGPVRGVGGAAPNMMQPMSSLPINITQQTVPPSQFISPQQGPGPAPPPGFPGAPPGFPGGNMHQFPPNMRPPMPIPPMGMRGPAPGMFPPAMPPRGPIQLPPRGPPGAQ